MSVGAEEPSQWEGRIVHFGLHYIILYHLSLELSEQLLSDKIIFPIMGFTLY